MHIVPLWLPLWTFLNMIVIGIGILPTFIFTFPAFYDTSTRATQFLSVCSYWMMNTNIFVAVPFSFMCFSKLRSHRAMLDQMAQFDLRHAKCSLETDRLVIEQGVVALFDEALEAPISVAFGADPIPETERLLPEIIDAIRPITSYPTRDEIIDEFNRYVRGPLRDSVMDRLGSEADISMKDGIALSLVVLLQVPVWVLGCDGFDCESSANAIGFHSVEAYMLVNLIQNSFMIPTYLCTFALLLRVNAGIASRVESCGLQMLCGVVSAIFVQSFEFAILAALSGTISVVATRFSGSWLLYLLACASLFGCSAHCFRACSVLPILLRLFVMPMT